MVVSIAAVIRAFPGRGCVAYNLSSFLGYLDSASWHHGAKAAPFILLGAGRLCFLRLACMCVEQNVDELLAAIELCLLISNVKRPGKGNIFLMQEWELHLLRQYVKLGEHSEAFGGTFIFALK